jgi:hypothetical protein
MARPYDEYEDTPLWRRLAQALADASSVSRQVEGAARTPPAGTNADANPRIEPT